MKSTQLIRNPLASALALGLASTLSIGSLFSVPICAQELTQQPSPKPLQQKNLPPASTTLDTVIVKGIPLNQSADDIITPVAVLSDEALDDQKSNTLGETVSSIPGVTASYFGPGVGRPVIRGLDGSRVAVLSNGLGTDDVSNVSQDHAVVLEPFLANQIEVLKGPSTLLYGSGAIGGVVNAVDGRIPEYAPSDKIGGRSELRYDSVSDGFTAMTRIDAGNDLYAVHADGVYRNNDNYAIANGEMANSAVDTQTGALGASIFGDWGFAGASVSRFLNDYGNPAEPGDDLDPPVTLKMTQTRYDIKAGLAQPFTNFENLKLHVSHTDYEHTEFEGNDIGTRFISEGDQLRLEATHRKLGVWQGAFGLQANRRDFEAIGEEAFVPATKSRAWGIFAIEQGEWERFKLEFGARGDRVSSTPINGTERSFTLNSLSAGGNWKFDPSWHLSLNLDRAQRAPAEEELFANGPHAATATFEIGNAALAIETSRQVELGLHYHGKKIEASVSTYRNRFDNFIYLADTGTFDLEDNLPIRIWSQTDALFRGFEGEAIFHVTDNDSGKLDLRLFGDRVRATREDGGNLPRIPAARLGLDLHWKANNLHAGLGVVHTATQQDTDVFETTTESYTLVNANLSYTFINNENSSWDAFIQGNNLTNKDARPATSVIKDTVPLPGLNISIGLRTFF